VPTTEIVIRRATQADLPALGRLGALLVRAHYDFDRHRFMEPRPNVEQGYAWFLGTQITDDDVAVFVAERNGRVLGYVYAGIEPQSWKELREEAGFIHDIVVSQQERRAGIAAALIHEAIEWLRARGMPRVMLWTAAENIGAQQLFARVGFRRTMVEMTLETPPAGAETVEK
jgi:ribosomal protein S18 acetylase RimI-like enzyme